MKIIIIITFFLFFSSAQEINQKMIIEAFLASEIKESSFNHIEKFLHNNVRFNQLKEKYHLKLERENLDNYKLVTLTPISTIALKNKLQYLLKYEFPQNFFVKNMIVPIKEEIPTSITYNKINQPAVIMKKKQLGETIKDFFIDLNSEWFGLIILVFIGFIFMYRRIKQMAKIKNLQEVLIKYQQNISNEVKQMVDKI